jgi:uncharacterized protein YjeT (DUF2065 family)
MIWMIGIALGLVFVIEGLAYALAPSFVEKMLAALAELPHSQRRMVGLIAVFIGVLLVHFCARGLH